MPDTGPESGVSGVVEDVKGKAKDVAGRPPPRWPVRKRQPRRPAPKPKSTRLSSAHISNATA